MYIISCFKTECNNFSILLYLKQKNINYIKCLKEHILLFYVEYYPNFKYNDSYTISYILYDTKCESD